MIEYDGDYRDGLWHTACYVKDDTLHSLYVDGVLRVSSVKDIGDASNTADLFIGSYRLGGADRYIGSFSQIGFANTTLNSTFIAQRNDSIANLNSGVSIDPYFDYPLTNLTEKQYYLKIESGVESISTIRVIAYENMTDINSSSYLDYSINSGESFVPLNSIIYEGYDYPFRIYSISGNEDLLFENIYLLEAGNDSEEPIINNCYVDKTNLSCNEIATLYCNITDNVGILNVNFTLNNTLTGVTDTHNANRCCNETDSWYHEHLFSGVNNETVTYDWYLSSALDLSHNLKTYDPNITINYTCLAECNENWTAEYGECLVNDTRLKYYIDNNSCGTIDEVPIDNGTYVSCNYCSQDIVEEYSECVFNGTGGQWNQTYIDNNFFSCCLITGLDSDCDIYDYPYNETFSENCSYLNDNFDLLIDTTVYFGFGIGGLNSDKTFGKIYINDSNTTYTCISYVLDIYNENLLQTNPPYTKRISSTFQIVPKEYEDREFFTTQNGLANIYWTNNNLVIDGRNYIFGVECTNSVGTRLKSERSAIVLYENINTPITRFVWIKDNITGLILGFIFLLIITALIGLFISRMRDKR